MGLLSEGQPMEWPDMVGWQDHVRKYGVEQFIRLYNKLKVIDGLFTYTINALQCWCIYIYVCRMTAGVG